MLRILVICNLIVFNNLTYSQETFKNSVFLIQFCNNDTCKPLATGFLVYDDTLGTDEFYLVTNLHVVKKGKEYLNQIVVFSRIDSNNKIINYNQSLIKDTTFINSEYLLTDENIIWKNCLDKFQDVVVLNLPKNSTLLNDYSPINLSNCLDYSKIGIADTLTTFGFPGEEWSNRNNNKMHNIKHFSNIEVQRIRIKLDSVSAETLKLEKLKSKIAYETNPTTKDSLNIMLSDSVRIIKFKLLSLKDELNYFQKIFDDSTKSYLRNLFQPLQYQGYFNSILDSLIVQTDSINTVFHDIISASVFTNSGQSGSPLFLLKEKKYYLVGIIFAKDKEHNSRAIPIKYLLSIIKENL